jgi:hypothetical protein
MGKNHGKNGKTIGEWIWPPDRVLILMKNLKMEKISPLYGNSTNVNGDSAGTP